MIRASSLLSVAASCALIAAACGDGDDSPPPADDESGAAPGLTQTIPGSAGEPLSAEGERVIQRARDVVSAHCRAVAEALAEGGAPPQASFDSATAALEKLAELARAEPGAEATDGTTPRLALGDIAENLEGTNCDPRLVARIDEELATLPAD